MLILQAPMALYAEFPRFWSKVHFCVSGCWLWTGTTDRGGYGKIKIAGKSEFAHRIAYESANGIIPLGLELDHLCRTHLCVKPEHLEAVTHGENLGRGMHPNMIAARTNICRKGHPFDEENTCYLTRGGRRCRTCHRNNEWNRRHPGQTRT